MKRNHWIYSILIFLITGLIIGCGGGGSDNPKETKTTYSTTSTKGDYTEWTITESEDGSYSLNATWQVIDNMGKVRFIYTFDATCGNVNSTGQRTCTYGTVTCEDGEADCPATMPSGEFKLMNVPGVALFVESNSSSSKVLNMGYIKDSDCSEDVSGDYTAIYTGLGQKLIFGMYRVDSNLLDTNNSSFGFDSTDWHADPTLVYRTSVEHRTLADDGCKDGVRFRHAGSRHYRAMVTQSGLMVVDFPAGEGGALGFKTNLAATLSQIANKQYAGYAFPDDSDPVAIEANATGIVDNRVTLNTSFDLEPTIRIMDLNVSDNMSSPAYPDFTVAPAGYAGSTLAATYPTPDNIPGIYKMDNLFDTGRAIMSAFRYNNKTVLIGAIYNYRSSHDTNPVTGVGFSPETIYNTGAFILFEKQLTLLGLCPTFVSF